MEPLSNKMVASTIVLRNLNCLERSESNALTSLSDTTLAASVSAQHSASILKNITSQQNTA